MSITDCEDHVEGQTKSTAGKLEMSPVCLSEREGKANESVMTLINHLTYCVATNFFTPIIKRATTLIALMTLLFRRVFSGRTDYLIQVYERTLI